MTTIKFKPFGTGAGSEPNTFDDAYLLQQWLQDLTHNDPVEILLSGVHRHWKDGLLLVPEGSTREIVVIGESNNIMHASFRWMHEPYKSYGPDFLQATDGTWQKSIPWHSNGQYLNLIQSDANRVLKLVNHTQSSFAFEGNVISTPSKNCRLDGYEPGRQITVSDTLLNNGTYTVIAAQPHQIEVEETLQSESVPTGGKIDVVTLLPGEYRFAPWTPEPHIATISLAENVPVVVTATNGAVLSNTTNVSLTGVNFISGNLRIENTHKLKLHRCSHSFVAGKAASVTKGSSGIHITQALVRDCSEGFYAYGGRNDEVNDFYVGQSLFLRLNHSNPNVVPAADGHAQGCQNGSDQVVEQCVVKGLQGVAFAHYPWSGAPRRYRNCGYSECYVDNIREVIPGTASGIQGIALNGDNTIGPLDNLFLTDNVVSNVNGPVGNGEAIRWKASDSGRDYSGVNVSGNIVLDSDIAYRNQRTASASRYQYRNNKAVGCARNVHITNTLGTPENCRADNNQYDSNGDYLYKNEGDFNQYKADASAFNPNAQEQYSTELTRDLDRDAVRAEAATRVAAIERVCRKDDL